jgi:hypothetical protein
MDVGRVLRKLFGEPARGANIFIFLFGPNKVHTTTGSPVPTIQIEIPGDTAVG